MNDEEIIDEEISIPGFYEEVLERIELRRVRGTLLVILGIKLILALCYTGVKAFLLISYDPTPLGLTRDSSMSAALAAGATIGAVLTVYIAIFLIFVVKDVRKGILVCAWLSIIDLLLTLLVVIFAIISITTTATGTNVMNLGLGATIVILILSGLALLLTISTVIASFELARLIELKKKNLLN